jgi:tetratricopeptide (TPR) repeat protein
MVLTLSLRVLLVGLLFPGFVSAGLRAPTEPRPQSSLPGSSQAGPDRAARTRTDASPASAAEAQAALQKAAHLVQQGRLDQADAQARLALDHPATRAGAHSVLGAIRFQQQRLDESITLLEEALRLEPRLLGAHLTLAEVYVLQERRELAADLFARALKLDPMNPTARFGLARLETAKGNYRRSLELAEPVIGAFKSFPEGLTVLATNYLRTGDHAAAAALAGHWTRLSDIPQSWAIRFAVLLAEGGAPGGAIAVLEHARRTGPPTAVLAVNLAGAYLLHGDPARALDTYDAALALEPGSLPALRQAAAIAERQGELERSLSYWIRAKKLQPDDPEILLGFGRVCLRMDLLDDAEPALEKAAALKPGELPYEYTLAAAKVGKRQFEAAQVLLEKLAASRPKDPQLQYALGSVHYVQGQLKEAAQRLEESVRLEPDQLAANYYLALVARDEGKDAEAVQRLEKVLARYPGHAPSHEALGALLVTAGRHAEAETHLREAVRLNPKSVRANYQLGLLLARLGRKDEADRQLQLTKSLRQEDEATSRLQLRLLDPDR